MSISGAEQREEPRPKTFVSDLPGEPYGDILERMHRILKPRTYFEIGCLRGNSLRLAGGKVNCRRNSIIVLHDCLPVDVYIVEREDNHARRLKLSSKPQWWAGDVWKTVVALRKFHPDLVMLVLDAPPTGLVLITNLDPPSRVLDEDYFRICAELAGVDLLSYGLERHIAECDIHNTRQFTTVQDFAARFWL
jgi:hypothetical protein